MLRVGLPDPRYGDLTILCFKEKKNTRLARTLKTLASDFIKTIAIVYPYNKYCYFSDKTLFLCVYFWQEMWLIVNVAPFGRETLVNGTL